MTKFLKGSQQIVSKDGQIRLDQGNNKFKVLNPDAGVLSLFFIGELVANITGGVLDGVTYYGYILDIYVHHGFSDQFPDLTPLYSFWRKKSSASSEEFFSNDLNTLTTSGGSATQSNDHQMLRRILVDTTKEEYILFRFIVTHVSGTVTVPAQAVRIIPAIQYYDQPLALVNASVQGGGGGILYEKHDFYI